MTSRWEEYKAKNGVTPLDLLNPKTKKAEKNQTFNKALNCYFFILC